MWTGHDPVGSVLQNQRTALIPYARPIAQKTIQLHFGVGPALSVNSNAPQSTTTIAGDIARFATPSIQYGSNGEFEPAGLMPAASARPASIEATKYLRERCLGPSWAPSRNGVRPARPRRAALHLAAAAGSLHRRLPRPRARGAPYPRSESHGLLLGRRSWLPGLPRRRGSRKRSAPRKAGRG